MGNVEKYSDQINNLVLELADTNHNGVVEDESGKIKTLLRRLPKILSFLRIEDAKISLIKSRDTTEHSANRLIILIKSEEASYVIKYKRVGFNSYESSYRQGDFSGTLAPKIFLEGKTFIMEEYIDPERFPSLDSIARENGLKQILGLIANVFSEIVSEEISYFDRHFLDKFKLRENSESVVIINWSKVKKTKRLNLVNKPNSRAGIAFAILHRRMDLLNEDLRKTLIEDQTLVGKNYTFTAFSIICYKLNICKDNYPDLYMDIAKEFEDINGDPDFLLQVIFVFNIVLIGLETFLEDSGQSDNAWMDVWLYFKEFVKKFSESIKNYNL